MKKKNYYKQGRVGKFWSNNCTEYDGTSSSKWIIYRFS